MQRQLSYITVVVLKPTDCAACPRRLAVGEPAIKDHRGAFHPSCYSEALCADYGHQAAAAARRAEAQTRKR